MEVLRPILVAKLLSKGDGEKANRMCCLQALIRTVYSSQRAIITATGVSSHCWKNLNLNSILQKAGRSRTLKLHSVEWWGWSGQSHHVQYFLCSSLMLFTVVQFESGTALLRDKADEGYHSWNRAFLTVTRPWSLLLNLLPIWEHPQWAGKRDRRSHQPKIKLGRLSITD